MTDDLLDRLRAADPAAHTAPAGPDRARVTAARRRRTTRRTVRAAAAPALAAALAAVALTTGPGGGTSLAVADVVARAAHAAAVDAPAIVVTRSEVDVVANGAHQLHEAKTTWVRVGADGKPVAVRSLLTDARGDHVRAGAEEASGDGTLARRDPETGAVERVRGSMTPSLVFQAGALLDRARDGADGLVELGEETTYEGRRALRLIVTGVDAPPGQNERKELLLDAESYAPLALTDRSSGTDVEGKPFTYALTEKVVEQRVLPDDATHRKQVELGGPTG